MPDCGCLSFLSSPSNKTAPSDQTSNAENVEPLQQRYVVSDAPPGTHGNSSDLALHKAVRPTLQGHEKSPHSSQTNVGDQGDKSYRRQSVVADSYPQTLTVETSSDQDVRLKAAVDSEDEEDIKASTALKALTNHQNRRRSSIMQQRTSLTQVARASAISRPSAMSTGRLSDGKISLEKRSAVSVDRQSRTSSVIRSSKEAVCEPSLESVHSEIEQLEASCNQEPVSTNRVVPSRDHSRCSSLSTATNGTSSNATKRVSGSDMWRKTEEQTTQGALGRHSDIASRLAKDSKCVVLDAFETIPAAYQKTLSHSNMPGGNSHQVNAQQLTEDVEEENEVVASDSECEEASVE